MGIYKGYKQSEEHVRKRIAAHIGAKRTLETCKNISLSKKGKPINQSLNQKRDWFGKNNPRWHGGIRMERENYKLVFFPEHPHASKAGYVREHRLVMEQYLKRYLKVTEVVHHIDHNPLNNKIENLWLFANQNEHVKFERHEIEMKKKMKDVCPVCLWSD